MINLNNVSFIQDAQGKKAVILSLDTYQEIKAKIEDIEDVQDYKNAKATIRETFPLSIAEKLFLSDESKIKVIREYRGYNATQFAKLVGCTESYISQIENNKRKGSIDTYKKFAQVLDVDLDIIV